MRLPFRWHPEAQSSAAYCLIGHFTEPALVIGHTHRFADPGKTASSDGLLPFASGSHSDYQNFFLDPRRPCAITWPNGSATNELPQNSIPLSGGPSKPVRFTAAT